MKKFFVPTSVVCLLTIFFAASSFKAKGNKIATNNKAAETIVVNDSAATAEAVSATSAADALYERLDLASLGMSKEVLQLAYKGQQVLIDRGAVNNSDLIAVCDFSQPSSKKRLYIIDTRNGRVVYNTYVAHGKNSGLNYAERFSNTHESLQSSLGFYVTKGTYIGKHGLSLKLAGLEKGFNDNAESRAVVMHGAEYIGTSRADAAYMGRSFGCPAVPQAESAKVINILKNGTPLFIYHPTAKYLNASRILNS